MIPNFSMDNAVESHVKALALNGDKEWEPGARKFQEWEERKQWVPISLFRSILISVVVRAWRSGAEKREKKRKRRESKQARQQQRQ